MSGLIERARSGLDEVVSERSPTASAITRAAPTKSVLIVSPYFPPAALAGVHRARHLAKHLPAYGWTPTVVCVHERFHEQKLDDALGALLSPDTHIVKVDALPARITRPAGLGDISLRACPQLASAVLRLVREHRPRAVLITGSPYYPMLMASRISRLGVPVVLDFQDPWVSDWGAAQKAISKAGVSHRLARWLEPKAVRAAAFITSVSDIQNEQMAQRYPELDRRRFAAIPIGGDPEDFASARNGATIPGNLLAPGMFNLSFVGTVMPRSAPLVRLFLTAVKRFSVQRPDLAARLRLNFIGTSNSTELRTPLVAPIARELQVEAFVHEHCQRVAFTTALGLVACSDAVLMIGSDEAHYTASKIYPALMSGRPLVSLFHVASSSHTILKAAGGGLAYAYDPGQPTADLVDDISAGLARLLMNPRQFGMVDPAAYRAYEAKAVAGQFARIFESLRPCASRF